MKRYKLIKNLLPVGTIIKKEAPSITERYGPHYEVLIPVGKDYTASLTIDAEAVEQNLDYFEEVTISTTKHEAAKRAANLEGRE